MTNSPEKFRTKNKIIAKKRETIQKKKNQKISRKVPKNGQYSEKFRKMDHIPGNSENLKDSGKKFRKFEKFRNAELIPGNSSTGPEACAAY